MLQKYAQHRRTVFLLSMMLLSNSAANATEAGTSHYEKGSDIAEINVDQTSSNISDEQMRECLKSGSLNKISDKKILLKACADRSKRGRRFSGPIAGMVAGITTKVLLCIATGTGLAMSAPLIITAAPIVAAGSILAPVIINGVSMTVGMLVAER